MEEILSWSRIVISLAVLVYASWSDFKTREVSNNLWILYAPIAFLLTFTQFLFFPPLGDTIQSMIYYGISFSITSIFSIALFYVGAFGGADAKALMCIALALPLFPEPIKSWSDFASPIFPITIFSNSVIVAALSIFYALFRNLLWKQRTGQKLFEGYEDVSLGRKILALLCGYKVSLSHLKESFLYPLEDIKTSDSGESEKKLLLFPTEENREEIIERLVSAESQQQKQLVWATPGLPMLIFVTIGLIIALVIGDIVWILLSQFL